MVAGHLQEKKGLFYVVLNFIDAEGKRKSKWISTGLPVKGNKRKACCSQNGRNISLVIIASRQMRICFLRTTCSIGSDR